MDVVLPDVRTIWMMIAVCALLFGVVLLASGFVPRRDRAMLLVGAGNVLGALGAALITLRDVWPDLLSVTAGNALLLAFWGLLWAGLRSFAGRPPALAVALGPAAVGFVLLGWVPVIADHYSVRTILITGTSCVFAVLIVRDGIAAERVERLRVRRAMLAVLGLWTVPLVARMTAAFFADESGILDRSSAQALPTMAYLVLVMTTDLCVLLMGRERLENALTEAAARDALTGVLNRAGLHRTAAPAIRQALRAGQPVSVALMDLDHFKSINDAYGHAVGDAVLVGFAATARETLRRSDVLARYGGEEFCAVLPGSDGPAAAEIAERVRTAFARARLVAGDASLHSTVSIGVAEVGASGGLETAIAAADRGCTSRRRGVATVSSW